MALVSHPSGQLVDALGCQPIANPILRGATVGGQRAHFTPITLPLEGVGRQQHLVSRLGVNPIPIQRPPVDLHPVHIERTQTFQQLLPIRLPIAQAG